MKRPTASSNSTALDMPGCLRLHAFPARLAARRAADTIAKPAGLDTTLTQAKRLSQNDHGSATFASCDDCCRDQAQLLSSLADLISCIHTRSRRFASLRPLVSESSSSSMLFITLWIVRLSALACLSAPPAPSMADGLQPELGAVCDDAGACFAGWNQPRLSASSSRVILTVVPETDRCTSCGKIVRRASSRRRSIQTIGYLCIIQLTQLPAAERSILTPLPFVWHRAVLQRSSSHKSVFVPASAMDMGCCATVDVKACSLSVDTSLYPVIFPGAILTVQL